MIAEIIINNYQLGAKLKITPKHKITNQERIDKSHILIRYSDITENELKLIEKVFAKKANII